jgi:hypothetical protein
MAYFPEIGYGYVIAQRRDYPIPQQTVSLIVVGGAESREDARGVGETRQLNIFEQRHRLQGLFESLLELGAEVFYLSSGGNASEPTDDRVYGMYCPAAHKGLYGVPELLESKRDADFGRVILCHVKRSGILEKIRQHKQEHVERVTFDHAPVKQKAAQERGLRGNGDRERVFNGHLRSKRMRDRTYGAHARNDGGHFPVMLIDYQRFIKAGTFVDIEIDTGDFSVLDIDFYAAVTFNASQMAEANIFFHFFIHFRTP